MQDLSRAEQDTIGVDHADQIEAGRETDQRDGYFGATPGETGDDVSCSKSSRHVVHLKSRGTSRGHQDGEVCFGLGGIGSGGQNTRRRLRVGDDTACSAHPLGENIEMVTLAPVGPSYIDATVPVAKYRSPVRRGNGSRDEAPAKIGTNAERIRSPASRRGASRRVPAQIDRVILRQRGWGLGPSEERLPTLSNVGQVDPARRAGIASLPTDVCTVRAIGDGIGIPLKSRHGPNRDAGSISPE